MQDTPKLKDLGSRIGEYVQCQSGDILNIQTLHGVIADLTSEMPELQVPLKDLVSRQSFTTLFPYARSGNGSIQRDALIQEIKWVYRTDILAQIEEVLNGFLDLSGSIILPAPQDRRLSRNNQIPSVLDSKLGQSLAGSSSGSTSESTIPQQTRSPAIVILVILITVTSMIVAAFFDKSHKENGRQSPEATTIQEESTLEDSQINELADKIFWRRHPYLKGKKLAGQNSQLAREWLRIRECEAIVDYQFYKIYPYMKGRLIQENQIEMSSTWKNLYDQNPGCR